MKNYSETIIERSDCDGDGIDDEKMNEGFFVAGISRQDILNNYDENEDVERYKKVKKIVENLTDNEMGDLADNLWDYIIDGYYERLIEDFEWDRGLYEYSGEKKKRLEGING